METQKPLLKDEDGEEVDVHMYRSMIGSLMYLTSSRPDIMYLKGQLKLGLWYPKNSPFDLIACTNSDYDGASLDRKSTTGGCQFLGCRLISWQCKKQTVVANSTTKAEYVAASKLGLWAFLLKDVFMSVRDMFSGGRMIIDGLWKNAVAWLCRCLKVNAARHYLLLMSVGIKRLLDDLRVTAAQSKNGNTAPKTIVVEGVEKVMPPTTAKEKAQKRLELELLGETISQEDMNQKLLRSWSREWNTHVVVWRNKTDLDTISMDDLYNNLKVYKPEVKGMSSSSSSTQNIDFVSSSNNNNSNTNRAVSTAQVVNTANGVSAANSQVNASNIDNLSDAVICAFLASQPNNPQLAHVDLQQIHPDDLEEMNLRWQMAIDVSCRVAPKLLEASQYAMKSSLPSDQNVIDEILQTCQITAINTQVPWATGLHPRGTNRLEKSLVEWVVILGSPRKDSENSCNTGKS
ncbi:hypothetical protein Tco_0991596 [Tanacetum coccineum]|uniref:Uncharacterized protein n=1 Tax=Tanacetum coccineum TaxID=301880 RepID=A0ABQ5F170_9ASTR